MKGWILEAASLLWMLAVLSLLSPSLSRKPEVKRDHCNKTVDIYEDVTSPDVTPENFGRPLTCWYRFRSFRGTPRDWILRIRFKKFKIGRLVNATTCHGGYMQIVDGNGKTEVSNRRDPGLFCGEAEQPQTFISETSFVKLVFHADNFTSQTYYAFDSRAEQQFEVYLRYGQHPELYPNRRGEPVAGTYCERIFRDCRLQTCYVQSPAYPGIYPRNLRCLYRLNTRLPFIKLYTENEAFNVDGQRCENIMTCPMRPITSCPYDLVRVWDWAGETPVVIGTFCGVGRFPHSIVGTGEDLLLEFITSPAGPLLGTGFHFNVGSWPGHVDSPGTRKEGSRCDWELTAEALEAAGDSEGIFLSVAHWYPPHTSCTYLMRGRPGEVVRLYFPSFRINRIEAPIAAYDGDCGESLTIYDSDHADDSRIIKTFCDTFSRPMEKHDFISSGNALFVRFESKTGSYSGSSLYYWAHYDFFNDTKTGEPVPGTSCDEVYASWRVPPPIQQPPLPPGSQPSSSTTPPPPRSPFSGRFRSPLNTLVYKQSGLGGVPTDVTCLYRFVTDRRLFARVILTLEAVRFKDHPFSPVPCSDCWRDKVDRLLIWEPSAVPTSNISTSASQNLGDMPPPGIGTCICRDHLVFLHHQQSRSRRPPPVSPYAPPPPPPPPPPTGPTLPMTFVSKGESMHLRLIVDKTHAASNYFKWPHALFEGRYEFVHSPLCGPTELPAATDGELVFPSYDNIHGHQHQMLLHPQDTSVPSTQPTSSPLGPSPAYPYPPYLASAFPREETRCIWELHVNRERDLWLHVDGIRFSSRSCAEGRLEVYLPSMGKWEDGGEPWIRICGENASSATLRDLPVISAAELLPPPPSPTPGPSSMGGSTGKSHSPPYSPYGPPASSTSYSQMGIRDPYYYGQPQPGGGGYNQDPNPMPPLHIPTSQTTIPAAPALYIHFVSGVSTRAAFKLAWTELFHLPRNPDGSLATSPRLSSPGFLGGEDEICQFLCPGNSGVCIPDKLVCNGVPNCPNSTYPPSTTAHQIPSSGGGVSEHAYSIDGSGGYPREGNGPGSTLDGVDVSGVPLHWSSDEDVELCRRRKEKMAAGSGDGSAGYGTDGNGGLLGASWMGANWLTVGLGAGGGAGLFVLLVCLVFGCRRCCRKDDGRSRCCGCCGKRVAGEVRGVRGPVGGMGGRRRRHDMDDEDDDDDDGGPPY
ncbi:uncharacterized protein [Hetaerina americana]|uniref:uncharacterized protein n=1 Tax=Hetaerina americana TaxID=62018 RepID=UPI003A7F2C5D